MDCLFIELRNTEAGNKTDLDRIAEIKPAETAVETGETFTHVSYGRVRDKLLTGAITQVASWGFLNESSGDIKQGSSVKTRVKGPTFFKYGIIGSCVSGSVVSYWHFRLTRFLNRFLISMKEVYSY